MVLAIDAQQEQQCLDQLQALGETAWVIGDIVTRGDQASVVFT
jgi:phosphoribosylaminoimidazole (AIR) synthetase